MEPSTANDVSDAATPGNTASTQQLNTGAIQNIESMLSSLVRSVTELQRVI